MTAGIQSMTDACMAKAATPPSGLSSAKRMAHGNTIASKEDKIFLFLMVYSQLLSLSKY
jgi:hypothetical protein